LRILREAITNAVRHGRASRIKIWLTREGRLHLKVSDNGVGFDPAVVVGDGFGLVSMRERVRDLGGELRVDSELGSGTVVEAVVP
jgi:signal transduction histidine kinase